MEYRANELAADRIIHMIGTLAGAVGAAILVGIAAAVAVLPTFSASLVYSICLVAMLGCSAAYNLAFNTSRRELSGPSFISGRSCLSKTRYGTASCWSRLAVITQPFCMGWCWPDREPSPCTELETPHF